MLRGNSKYLQIAAYVMLAVIFVLIISIARDCSQMPFVVKQGHSEGDTLDIALIYGPGGYYANADTLAGINLEIAEEFQKQTERPVNIWAINDPATGLSALQSGQYDILASLPLDNYLKSNFPVSESVFLDRLVLVQLKDSVTGSPKVESSLDLNEKSVYVAAGSSAVNRLSNLAEEIGGQIFIQEMPEMSDELVCLQVASGEIPMAVVNEKIAQTLAEKYPGLSYDNSVSFTQFQVWVFNPADTVARQQFNDWFKTFSKTPKYQKILSKY